MNRYHLNALSNLLVKLDDLQNDFVGTGVSLDGISVYVDSDLIGSVYADTDGFVLNTDLRDAG